LRSNSEIGRRSTAGKLNGRNIGAPYCSITENTKQYASAGGIEKRNSDCTAGFDCELPRTQTKQKINLKVNANSCR
jgi:hypothetical protein